MFDYSVIYIFIAYKDKYICKFIFIFFIQTWVFVSFFILKYKLIITYLIKYIFQTFFLSTKIICLIII